MSKIIYKGPLPVWAFIFLGLLLGGFYSVFSFIEGNYSTWLLFINMLMGVGGVLFLWLMVKVGRNPESPLRKHLGLLVKIGSIIVAALTLISLCTKK